LAVKELRSTLPLAALVTALAVLVGAADAARVHVVLFTNAPLPGLKEAERQAHAFVSVYPIPRQPEDASRMPWDRIVRDVSSADVVVIDAMGGLPSVLIHELSARMGARTSDPSALVRSIARRVPVVMLVASKPERSVVEIRGGRLASVARAGTGVPEAVAAHVWLCLHSGDPAALLTFLVWVADPSYPTDRVVPPRRLGRVMLSVYVPGSGYRSLAIRVDPQRFHRWLRELERGGKGLLVYDVRLARELPGWVVDALDSAVPRMRDLLGGLPDDLVVVFTHGVYALTRVRAVVEELTDRLDRAARRYGVRAVAVFCGLGVVTPAQVLDELRELGKRVEVVVSARAFTLNFPRPAEYVLSRLDVPLVQIVFPFSSDERMAVGRYVSERSGPLLEWTYQVQLGSEREGGFWFRVLWLNAPEGPRLLPGAPDDLAGLVERLLRLRKLPNRDKRIALVVYCYPPGRSGLGAAYLDVPRSLVRLLAALAGAGFDLGPATRFFSRLWALYRESPEKARLLEKALSTVFGLLAAGVDPHRPERSVALLVNVGPWSGPELRRIVSLYRGARGEWSTVVDGVPVRVIVDRGLITVRIGDLEFTLGRVSSDQLVPADRVKEWFREDVLRRLKAYLDLVRECNPAAYERARRAIEGMLRAFRETWGPATSNRGLMICDGHYLVPALVIGKVAIVLQPPRGWSATSTVYHSRTLPPHWQYIAAYEWIRRVFRADAVVYVGTHGTFEFLPGHDRGLTVTDWTHLLLPDVPQAYFYIVSNPGEALLAKYRAGAVLLTYPSPPTGYFRDYRRYAELERLWSEYVASSAYGGYPAVQREILRKIVEEARRLGLLDEIVRAIFRERGQAPPPDPVRWAMEHPDEFLSELHDYLLSLRGEACFYGLHTLLEDLPEDVALQEATMIYAPRFAPYLAVVTGFVGKATLQEVYELADERPELYERLREVTRRVLERFLRLITSNRALVERLDEWVRLVDEGELKDDASLLSRADAILHEPSVRSALLSAFSEALSEEGLVKVTSEYDEDLLKLLAGAYREYVHVLRSGEYELRGLLAFLSGGHVPTGGLGEPLWNPRAFPVGRNGVPFDPHTLPTPEAWEVAKRLVDELLARYYRLHHRWPETVTVILFAAHELTSGGLGIAEVLYLLGVKPVWDPGTGRVVALRVIPLDKLTVRVDGVPVRRPRIDVIALCTAVMTSIEPLIRLLALASRMVCRLNEPPEWNYPRKHYLRLVEAGVEERIAATRVFGEPPGDPQGTGVNRVIEFGWSELTEGLGISGSGTLDQRLLGRVVQSFESRVAYAFVVEGPDGTEVRLDALTGYRAALSAVRAFRLLARTVDVVVDQIVNAFNVIDVNDYYSWAGGMAAYVRWLRGREPLVYFTVARNPMAASVQSLAERVSIEVRTELLSPSWWRALMEHGPDVGWHEVEKRLGNLIGVLSTMRQARSVGDVLLTRIARTIVAMLRVYRPNTPLGWANVQSALAWLVEAARVGLWHPDRRTLADVVRAWAEVTARYGPSTCHHTSPNPSTVAYVQRVASILHLADVQRLLPKVVAAYRSLDNPEIVRRIASLERAIPPSPRSSPETVPTTGTPAVGAPATTAPGRPARGSGSPGPGSSALRARAVIRPTSATGRASYGTGAPGGGGVRALTRAIARVVAETARVIRTVESPHRVAASVVSPARSIPPLPGTTPAGTRRARGRPGVPRSRGESRAELPSASGGRILTRAASGTLSSLGPATRSRATAGGKARGATRPPAARTMSRMSSAATPPREIWEWVLALLLTILVASVGALWKRVESAGKW